MFNTGSNIPVVEMSTGAAITAPTSHSYRREKHVALAVTTATVLYAFYYAHSRTDPYHGKARRKAVRALQSTFRDLTDAPADMQLVATASAGLIPAAVVLRGRAAVLDWVEEDLRKPWAVLARLTGVMQMLKPMGATHVQGTATPPPPPTGLRTRWDWVQQYPRVMESFLTDPDTGVRRNTRERYILAQSPAGATLLLGARRRQRLV